jgi:hypothetical protein
MTVPAVGTLAQFGTGTTSTITSRYDFLSSSFDIDETFIDGNGLRGTLSPDISRVRTGPYRVHGTVSMQPNVAELKLLLPWILGTLVSGSTYALADTFLSRWVGLDFNAGDFWTATGVAVNRATFHADQFSSLNLDLELLGQTTAASGSFPALSIDVATSQYVFTDLVLTNGATTITPKNFSLSVDNHLDPDWFLNSLTLSAVVKLDRTIMFACDLSYGDFKALYVAGGASTPVAVVGTFTNPTNSDVLTFTMANVALPRLPRTIQRAEVMYHMSGRAYASGATKELVVGLT